MITTPELQFFQSPSDPSRWIQYRQLNKGAKHTLVFCYGAGPSSEDLTLFQDFTAAHKDLSVLCIDRWVHRCPPNTPGWADPVDRYHVSGIFSDLTSVSVELLDSLGVHEFSVAGHSAGGMVIMAFVRDFASSGRLKFVFPMCAHMPPPWPESAMLERVATMSEWMFTLSMSVNRIPEIPVLGPLVLKMMGSKRDPDREQEEFVDGVEVRRLHRAYKADEVQTKVDRERYQLDVRMCMGRIEGLDLEYLRGLYRGIGKTKELTKIVWFTTDNDIFVGPQTVGRLLKEVDREDIEVINVKDATHADIWLQRCVWDRMYQEMSTE